MTIKRIAAIGTYHFKEATIGGFGNVIAPESHSVEFNPALSVGRLGVIKSLPINDHLLAAFKATRAPDAVLEGSPVAVFLEAREGVGYVEGSLKMLAPALVPTPMGTRNAA